MEVRKSQESECDWGHADSVCLDVGAVNFITPTMQSHKADS